MRFSANWAQGGVDTTLSFDFHVHSSKSVDSILNPEMILRIGMREKLDGLAVTDHDTVQGGLKTARLATKLKDCDLTVVPGVEIETERGHVLGLFVQEEIRARRFSSVLDEIRAQDGFSVLAHPMKFPELVSMEVLKAVDAVEVLNARIAHRRNEDMRKLAVDHDLSQTAGSDAHTPIEIGRARVVFDRDERLSSSKDLRNWLSGSRVTGKESPRFVHYVSVSVEKIRQLV